MRQLERIQDKVEGIWSYTELEISDYSAVGLQKHLSIISEILNDVLDHIENLNKIQHQHLNKRLTEV